ncbi:MAG: TetR/AcrR family transcriptional regulator [Proteobacteria bacterium]|nr:TetR/AcrR family transcriptional regulator [Pseudomonadota bacterium]
MSSVQPNEKVLRTAGRERRRAFVEAATRLFLEKGFHAVSIDAIVKAAGGSKASLYSYFGNKEALFGAVVEERARHFLETVTTGTAAAKSPEIALREMGRRFISLATRPDALALYRVVIAEAPRLPELAKMFFDSGPARTQRALADYLRHQHEAGVMHIPDPAASAEHLLGLLMGLFHLRAVLNLDTGDAETHVDGAVTAFLAACGRPAAASGGSRGIRN